MVVVGGVVVVGGSVVMGGVVVEVVLGSKQEQPLQAL